MRKRRLLLLVLVSLVVGWVAAWTGGDEIAWEVAALTFTALATLMLAFATFGLAKQTQNEVDAATKAANAASKSAEVGASSLAAAIRPILAQDPTQTPTVDKAGVDGRHHVRVRAQLRNVGSGLAIVENPRLLTSIPPGTTMRAEVRGSAVPARELAYLEFDVVFDSDSQATSFQGQ